MPSPRNILSLACSRDLRQWHLVCRLIADGSGLSPLDSMRLTGFQYVDWQFDGNNIIYLVRAAHHGAVRYHDANRILYRVLGNYARLITSCLWRGERLWQWPSRRVSMPETVAAFSLALFSRMHQVLRRLAQISISKTR